jgi:hypothetical protein
MSRVVVALLCAATLAACDKRHEECPGLVAAANGAHTSIAGAPKETPDASLKDEARTATSLGAAASGANDTMRALGGTLTTSSLKSVTVAYADVLRDATEAARPIPALADKAATLDRGIRGNQASTLWSTALTEVNAFRQRCKAAPPPHACAYVIPRLEPFESLATDPDGLTKLAGQLEGAPRDDQSFEIDLYNFRGTTRTIATALRAVTNETIEKRAVDADLAAAKAKLAAALAREPAAEEAIESECAR